VARREDLVAKATDYVLEHGVIGLSLRPLAAALDTSDRMLIYHFGGKDALMAAILETSNDWSVEVVRNLAGALSVRDAVLALWDAARSPQLDRCQRAYTQAAALGLLGREPYLSTVRRANAAWVVALADYMIRSGAAPERAPRIAELVDATLMGLQLDLSFEGESAAQRTAVADLADAAQRISDG
jgi:AcrR family transcriptional regulator